MAQLPTSDDSHLLPVISDKANFNVSSGSWLERVIFNNRIAVIVFCLIATLLFGAQIPFLQINASFDNMLPRGQPFIKNYLANKADLGGLGNSVRVVVENTRGDIYDAHYLDVLQKINDAAFLIPGVDRLFMKSLWTPQVRWTQITEDGYRGGPVMPDTYDGSAQSIDLLRTNVERAGIVGGIVSNDQKSSMIFLPLMDEVQPGVPLDYGAFSRALETKLRSYQSDTIKVHIIGFGKLVGDLIAGVVQITTYFAVAAAIAGIMIFIYTRCIRSTVLVLACSAIAVSWQLGIVHLMRFPIDPYSILVPFLIFAIGVSHGAQKMNGIIQDVGRGCDRYVAARYTFRRLFLAGFTALVADAIGFAVLMLIDIPVIRNLAMTASIGVGVLIFTNLVLLPILLSYFGVRSRIITGSVSQRLTERVWAFLDLFTRRRWATGALAVAAVVTIASQVIGSHLQVGDLDAGAPELREDSRYNLDNAFITKSFGLSSDIFAIIVKTAPDGARSYPTLIEEDRLEQRLRELPVVQTTVSAADLTRFGTSGIYEGSPKWLSLNRDWSTTSQASYDLLTNNPDLINADASTGTVIAYLSDHRAESLRQVVNVAESFAEQHSNGTHQFLLAAGSAGIEAATNIAVAASDQKMLLLVYCAVIILCFVTFRSWRAVIVAVVPLMMTSIMCRALMVLIGVGEKVATLPVVALGVGIGVDYALYLLSVQLAQQRAGVALNAAYHGALRFTGRVVALVGMTLAAGVVTWAWSPIKFQADMGILLTFMFLWNMIGALILIPSLSHFLLPTSVFSKAPKSARQPISSHKPVSRGAGE